MKILLVEDEPALRETIRLSLEKEKFLVETASDFHSAEDKISAYDYSCILLDINLPGGSGLDILKILRESGKSDSVIIISAKDSLDDKIKGLGLGADDYLVKPFHIAELNARIRSVLRRKNFEGKQHTEAGNLKLFFDERNVTVDDIVLSLNRKEYDILVYLLANRNRLVQKTALAESVWGDQADDSDDFEFVYSQIKNLRKKLKDHNATIEIQSVYGVGYKLITA